MAQVTGFGSFLRNPPARGGREAIARLDREDAFEIADEIGSQAKHHGCFPLARMGHLALPQAERSQAGCGSQVPIGAHYQQQVIALAMALPRFKYGLLSRHIIPTMAIDQYEA